MPESFTFQGIKIVCDPVFETDERLSGRAYLVSEHGARAIEEAQAKMGRGLTVDEALSCLIHRNCIAVLECAAEAKPKRKKRR